MNRSSENKVLSYRLTGQNYLTEVLAFPAKVHSKRCENGEGKSVGDSVYKVSWGKSSVEGLTKGISRTNLTLTQTRFRNIGLQQIKVKHLPSLLLLHYAKSVRSHNIAHFFSFLRRSKEKMPGQGTLYPNTWP